MLEMNFISWHVVSQSGRAVRGGFTFQFKYNMVSRFYRLDFWNYIQAYSLLTNVMCLTTKHVRAWLITLYKLKWTINDHNDFLLIYVFMLLHRVTLCAAVAVMVCTPSGWGFRMFRALVGAKCRIRVSDIGLYIAQLHPGRAATAG